MVAGHQIRKPPRMGRARLLMDLEPDLFLKDRLDVGFDNLARLRMVVT